MKSLKYTLAQHSAYAAKRDPMFKHAVELVSIHNPRTVDRIRAAGGLIFDDYNAANAAEDGVNYPEGADGLIPQARGTFHTKLTVEGMAIYLPPKGDAA